MSVHVIFLVQIYMVGFQLRCCLIKKNRLKNTFMFPKVCFLILIFNSRMLAGTLQGNATEFGHTTLSNLDPESPFLWVHITIGS